MLFLIKYQDIFFIDILFKIFIIIKVQKWKYDINV